MTISSFWLHVILTHLHSSTSTYLSLVFSIAAERPNTNWKENHLIFRLGSLQHKARILNFPIQVTHIPMFHSHTHSVSTRPIPSTRLAPSPLYSLPIWHHLPHQTIPPISYFYILEIAPAPSQSGYWLSTRIVDWHRLYPQMLLSSSSIFFFHFPIWPLDANCVTLSSVFYTK